jgi:aconitase A
MNKPRDTNTSADDEFGFDYNMSEEEFNKSHRKALKKADSSYKDVWVKIAEGLYEKQTKIVKKKKKKKLPQSKPFFRGLGSSNRTNRGPLGYMI